MTALIAAVLWLLHSEMFGDLPFCQVAVLAQVTYSMMVVFFKNLFNNYNCLAIKTVRGAATVETKKILNDPDDTY